MPTCSLCQYLVSCLGGWDEYTSIIDCRECGKLFISTLFAVNKHGLFEPMSPGAFRWKAFELKPFDGPDPQCWRRRYPFKLYCRDCDPQKLVTFEANP